MLQNKPNPWSCSVTAFAMAIGIPVKQLVEEIGHDGGEKIFTHLPEPMCRRGFHSQELIKFAWMHGFACTPIEMYPMLRCEPILCTSPLYEEAKKHSGGLCLPTEHSVLFGSSIVENQARFVAGVRVTRGVMEGQGCRCHHAVYYHYGQICDPDGEQYEYSPEACEERGFYGNRLWIFTEHGLV